MPKADIEVTTRRAGGRGETRQLLMDAAAKLFAEQGYPPTTVPDIVKAAGVGHGTFYEYFKSRRDILVAITEHAAQANDRRPELASKSLPDRIRLEITWYLMDYVEHLTLSKIWHVASNFDPEIASTVRDARRANTGQVEKALTGYGLPEGIDPAVAACAVTSMLEEFAFRWFIDGEGPGTSASDVLSAAETLTRMALTALGLESFD
jgi:AcrR family transcriptional regulator